MDIATFTALQATLQTAMITIGMPILRSVGGWATNALKDGKITKFELKKLAETILRTGLIGVFVYFGAEGWGIDIGAAATAATAVIIDMVLSAWKENKNVTKR